MSIDFTYGGIVWLLVTIALLVLSFIAGGRAWRAGERRLAMLPMMAIVVGWIAPLGCYAAGASEVASAWATSAYR